MINEKYNTSKITASLTSHCNKVYLMEMTLWRHEFKCNTLKKTANLYQSIFDKEEFGFTVDDELGNSTDIWITDIFPQLKNKKLFSICQIGKEEFAITVIDQNYFN